MDKERERAKAACMRAGAGLRGRAGSAQRLMYELLKRGDEYDMAKEKVLEAVAYGEVKKCLAKL